MAEFSWSPERAEIYRRCPRQYWFQFHGSGPAWDRRTDERTRTIFVLKQLQSREAWMDSTVRNCLRWILDTLRKTGAAPSEELTLQHLGRRMNKDYVSSGEGLHWEDPANHRGLAEHEYEDRDVADEDWEQLFQKALLVVSAFFHSDTFRQLQAVPKNAWLGADAHRDGDRVIVYNWTTGFEAAPSSAALGVLLSSEQWKLPPGNITLRTYDLWRNVAADYCATAAELDDAHAGMDISVSDLQSLGDKPENDFAFTEDEAECARCNFARICPKFQ